LGGDRFSRLLTMVCEDRYHCIQHYKLYYQAPVDQNVTLLA